MTSLTLEFFYVGDNKSIMLLLFTWLQGCNPASTAQYFSFSFKVILCVVIKLFRCFNLRNAPVNFHGALMNEAVPFQFRNIKLFASNMELTQIMCLPMGKNTWFFKVMTRLCK